MGNPFRRLAGEAVEAADFIRTSGELVCPACGLTYYRHPHAPEHLDYEGRPYLRRLCDGRLAKL